MTLFEVSHLDTQLPLYEQGFILLPHVASLGFGVRVAGDVFDVFPFFVTRSYISSVVLFWPSEGSWARRCLVWSGETYLSYRLVTEPGKAKQVEQARMPGLYTRYLPQDEWAVRSIYPMPVV